MMNNNAIIYTSKDLVSTRFITNESEARNWVSKKIDKSGARLFAPQLRHPVIVDNDRVLIQLRREVELTTEELEGFAHMVGYKTYAEAQVCWGEYYGHNITANILLHKEEGLSFIKWLTPLMEEKPLNPVLIDWEVYKYGNSSPVEVGWGTEVVASGFEATGIVYIDNDAKAFKVFGDTTVEPLDDYYNAVDLDVSVVIGGVHEDYHILMDNEHWYEAYSCS